MSARRFEMGEARGPILGQADRFAGGHLDDGQHLARTGRLDELSHGLCSSDDFVSIKRYMAQFMAAGFHAICQGPSPPKR